VSGGAASLVARALWLRDAVMTRWWNAFGRAWLPLRGVRLGQGVHFQGLPIVSMVPGSAIEVGDGASLCSLARATALGVERPVVLRALAAGARIEIGAECGLSGTVICAATTVRVGPECLFGADVKLMDTDFHPLKAAGRRHNNRAEDIASAPITIGRNVFLGTGCMVLKGVRIGDNAVIGAGSVVTRDIPAGAIACGNPARVVGRVPDSAGDRPSAAGA
jgi:acetyltransferase-like isoleucine patch superfamily enzyme